MATIALPDELETLLAQEPRLRDRLGPVREATAAILTANRLTFFPGYTDHGIEHVEAVLRDMWRLVPQEIRALKVLTAADAACICLAGMLHDLGMHLQPDGFLDLVSDRWTSPLTPARQQHYDDRPWGELWDRYLDEAGRFDDRALTRLLGPRPDDHDDAEAAVRWGVRDPTRLNVNRWDAYDRLVIGEFIRRYHPRLAHEIAWRGFPAISNRAADGGFAPPAVQIEERLADIAGVVARSHGLALRQAADDLRRTYDSRFRPANVLATFHMALLRVADYLQLARDRAPTVLLHLARPESPISIGEWAKHQAVDPPLWDSHDDHEGVQINIHIEHDITTHLQIRDLLLGLQREMDHSAAMLAETYGAQRDAELQRLRLAKTRVYHNLDHPDLVARLPYVPRRVTFTTATAEVLALLIKPLYGGDPNFGIRELMQNAVDAVRELRAFLTRHPEHRTGLAQDAGAPDVLVSIEADAKGQWFVQVTDRGIGMDDNIIVDYFLRAGASLRSSPAWKAEFAEAGHPAVMRTGRFGIGALAAFLLGDVIQVRSRRVGASRGLEFTAGLTTDPIRLAFVDSIPVGTTIRVAISEAVREALKHPPGDSNDVIDRPALKPGARWDWFLMEDVIVERRISGKLCAPTIARFPAPEGEIEDEWRLSATDEFPAMVWSPFRSGITACNGFFVGDPSGERPYQRLGKDFSHPDTCVMDPGGRFPLDVTRMKAPPPANVVPALERDMYADIVMFCIAAMDVTTQGEKQPMDLPHVGYPRNVRGVSAESARPDNFRQQDAEAKMWMASPEGAAIIDEGLIHRSGLTRLVVLESRHEVLFPVAGHLSIRCPVIENNRVLKLSEWLELEFGYSRFRSMVGRRKQQRRPAERNAHWIEYADGEALKSEYQGLDLNPMGDVTPYQKLRKQHPELTSIIVAHFTDLQPVETALSRTWIDLLGIPFVPFDVEQRQKIVDRLPTRYLNWLEGWRRHLTRQLSPPSTGKPPKRRARNRRVP